MCRSRTLGPSAEGCQPADHSLGGCSGERWLGPRDPPSGLGARYRKATGGLHVAPPRDPRCSRWRGRQRWTSRPRRTTCGKCDQSSDHAGGARPPRVRDASGRRDGPGAMEGGGTEGTTQSGSSSRTTGPAAQAAAPRQFSPHTLGVWNVHCDRRRPEPPSDRLLVWPQERSEGARSGLLGVDHRMPYRRGTDRPHPPMGRSDLAAPGTRLLTARLDQVLEAVEVLGHLPVIEAEGGSDVLKPRRRAPSPSAAHTASEAVARDQTSSSHHWPRWFQRQITSQSGHIHIAASPSGGSGGGWH